jgi:hypothetical protein
MTRTLHTVLACALTLAMATGPIAVRAAVAPDVEGLVEVKVKKVDKGWLLPGTDFRQYTRVMIDPAEVAFRKGWMLEQNRKRMRMGGGRKITEADLQEIAAVARSGFGHIFEQAFVDAGWQIAREPAEDVLRIEPEIVDLYITAPDMPTVGNTRSYTVEAGEARLVLAAHDSLTNALLAVAVDRRQAGGHGGGGGAAQFTWTTRTSNRSDFEHLFRRWARICVEGIAELKAQSPVAPEPKRKR